MSRKKDFAAALFFFLLSAGYFMGISDIPLYFGDEDAPFNAQTFPRLLAILGLITSGLMIFVALANKDKSDEPTFSHYNWDVVGYMAVLMIVFGIVLGTLGFFVATLGFLFAGLLLLGERRPVILLAVPFAAASGFAILLHGLLDIYMDDPLLTMLGII